MLKCTTIVLHRFTQITENMFALTQNGIQAFVVAKCLSRHYLQVNQDKRQAFSSYYLLENS